MVNKLKIICSLCVLFITTGVAVAGTFQSACISPVTTRAFIEDMDTFIAQVEDQYDSNTDSRIKQCGVSKETILGFDIYKDPFDPVPLSQRMNLNAEPIPDILSTSLMSNWEEVKKIIDYNANVSGGVDSFLAITFSGNTAMFDLDNDEITQKFEKLRELAYRSSLTCSMRADTKGDPLLWLDVDVNNKKLPLYQSVLGRYLMYSTLYADFIKAKKAVLDKTDLAPTPVGIERLSGVASIYKKTLYQTYGMLLGKMYKTRQPSMYPNLVTLRTTLGDASLLLDLEKCQNEDGDCGDTQIRIAVKVGLLINPFTANIYTNPIPPSRSQDGKISACYPAGFQLEQLTASWDSLLTSGSEFGKVMESFGTAWTDITESVTKAGDTLTKTWEALSSTVEGSIAKVTKAFNDVKDQLKKLQDLMSMKSALQKNSILAGESTTNIQKSGNVSCSLKTELNASFIPQEVYTQIYSSSLVATSEARCQERKLYESIKSSYENAGQDTLSFFHNSYWRNMFSSFHDGQGINSLAEEAYKRLNFVCHNHQYVQGADCADPSGTR